MNKIEKMKIYLVKNIKIISISLFFTLLSSTIPVFSVQKGENTFPVEQIITNKKISVNFKNKSLRTILVELQKLSGVGIAFKDDGEIDKYKALSCEMKDTTVEAILTKILANTDLIYTIKNNTITIGKKPAAAKSNEIKRVSLQVKGVVLSADSKKPIVGATLIVEGTTTGTITDDQGKFSLWIYPDSKVEVSFVGMKTLLYDKPLTQGGNIIISMEPDAMAVDDVIVTGIFNKARESYTGSVTSITAKDIKNFKGQNMLQTLRNFDPALNIVQNNDFGSDPNRLPEINIRGNSSIPMSVKELNENVNAQSKLNEPLVIIDGFEVSLQKLMDLTDEEVELINILKDASATAIYGSRGANGVIVVNTKAPQAGKLKVFVQAGINLEIPDLTSYDLLNAREKLAFEKSIGLYSSTSPVEQAKLDLNYSNIEWEILSGVDTYWLSQPLRTGVGSNYNLRLEGGSQEFRWSVSANYNNTKGVMKGSEKEVFGGTINLTYNYKNLIFKNQSIFSNSKGNESNYGTFSDYTTMNPYSRIRDDNGNYIKSYNYGSNYSDTPNPLYNSQFNNRNNNSTTTITNNFSAEWNIIEGLTARAKIGVTKDFNDRDLFVAAGDTRFKDYASKDYLRKGTYDYNTGENFGLDFNATLSYSKVFNEKHQLYAGLDYSLANNKYYLYSFAMEGYHNDNFDFLANGLMYKKDGKAGGSESLSRRLGITGNVNYTFDNRYYADLSYRVDGSSQFGAENKFAPFWSIGLGWNLHKEKFLENSQVVNSLRLKGSYGYTGSQQFNSYQALTTYGYDPNDRYMFSIPAILKGYGNENLKWQSTKQVNIGTSFSLFGNRFSGSFDYYSKNTSNLLSQLDIPLSTGFSSYTENVGKVKNVGYEAMLSGYLIRDTKRDIIWTVTVRLINNKNTISELSEAIKKQTAEYELQNVEQNKLLYEGHSVNSIYVVKSLGIDPSTGQEVLLNRDGVPGYVWNSNARILAGNSEPKYKGNISSMFTYKNLTLNLSFGYHWGGQQYNQTLIDKVEILESDARRNVDRRALNGRWTTPGQVTFYKSFKGLDGMPAPRTKASSRFVQDDNMFSLQSASIQYNLSNRWVKENLRMESLNIAFNMSDLFYVTSIKRERGTSYPFSQRMSMSLSLIF